MSDDPLSSPVPLTGSDAQVLDLLAQVVAIGRNRGTWDSSDVQRVSEAHLHHPHTLRRQLLNERARADRLFAENERLRAKVRQLGATLLTPPTTMPRVVYLTPKRAAVLELMAAGASRKQIAQRLRIGESAAADLIRRVLIVLGVKRQPEAMALVLSGGVEVRVLEEGERAA